MVCVQNMITTTIKSYSGVCVKNAHVVHAPCHVTLSNIPYLALCCSLDAILSYANIPLRRIITVMLHFVLVALVLVHAPTPPPHFAMLWDQRQRQDEIPQLCISGGGG